MNRHTIYALIFAALNAIGAVWAFRSDAPLVGIVCLGCAVVWPVLAVRRSRRLH